MSGGVDKANTGTLTPHLPEEGDGSNLGPSNDALLPRCKNLTNFAKEITGTRWRIFFCALALLAVITAAALVVVFLTAESLIVAMCLLAILDIGATYALCKCIYSELLNRRACQEIERHVHMLKIGNSRLPLTANLKTNVWETSLAQQTDFFAFVCDDRMRRLYFTPETRLRLCFLSLPDADLLSGIYGVDATLCIEDGNGNHIGDLRVDEIRINNDTCIMTKHSARIAHISREEYFAAELARQCEQAEKFPHVLQEKLHNLQGLGYAICKIPDTIALHPCPVAVIDTRARADECSAGILGDPSALEEYGKRVFVDSAFFITPMPLCEYPYAWGLFNAAGDDLAMCILKNFATLSSNTTLHYEYSNGDLLTVDLSAEPTLISRLNKFLKTIAMSDLAVEQKSLAVRNALFFSFEQCACAHVKKRDYEAIASVCSWEIFPANNAINLTLNSDGTYAAKYTFHSTNPLTGATMVIAASMNIGREDDVNATMPLVAISAAEMIFLLPDDLLGTSYGGFVQLHQAESHLESQFLTQANAEERGIFLCAKAGNELAYGIEIPNSQRMKLIKHKTGSMYVQFFPLDGDHPIQTLPIDLGYERILKLNEPTDFRTYAAALYEREHIKNGELDARLREMESKGYTIPQEFIVAARKHGCGFLDSDKTLQLANEVVSGYGENATRASLPILLPDDYYEKGGTTEKLVKKMQNMFVLLKDMSRKEMTKITFIDSEGHDTSIEVSEDVDGLDRLSFIFDGTRRLVRNNRLFCQAMRNLLSVDYAQAFNSHSNGMYCRLMMHEYISAHGALDIRKTHWIIKSDGTSSTATFNIHFSDIDRGAMFALSTLLEYSDNSSKPIVKEADVFVIWPSSSPDAIERE
jgi:hypothetical protein